MYRTLLPWLAAGAFLSLGAGAAFAPEALADNYGMPIDDSTGRAYVRSVGARDVVLGLLIAYFLRTRNRSALTATLGVSSLAGFSDFAIVRSARGNDAPGSLAIHFFGTLGLLFTAVLSAAMAEDPD